MSISGTACATKQKRFSLIRRRPTKPTAAHSRPTQAARSIEVVLFFRRTSIGQRVQEWIYGRVEIAEPECHREYVRAYTILAQSNHYVYGEVRREADREANYDCH